MDLYGRKVEDLPDVIRGFRAFLSPYPASDVVKAFERYARNRSTFPKPAEIISILENRVKRDSAYYRKLVQEQKEGGPYSLSQDEKAYIASYEAQTLDDFE